MADDELLQGLLAEVEEADTPAGKWSLIERAWVGYCQRGASHFDWDFDSRDLMAALTDHHAFEGGVSP